MIHALGYCQDTFDPSSPGRLCRGRERWIEPFALEGEVSGVQRLVITGATFEDDSARDARRGLPYSTLHPAQVVAALFPRRTLLAFTEDGHPADIPAAAEGIEAYTGYRAGGQVVEALVRWHLEVRGMREIREVYGEDPFSETLRGLAAAGGDEDREALLDAIFLLTGMSTLDSPPARYQPSALPAVLAHTPAVVVFHRDKHGPAVGVYSRDPVRVEGRLDELCDKHGVLPVPFAIPPMLARWDRALSEARAAWMETRDDEFPVPPAAEPSSWEARRRRRKKKRKKREAARSPRRSGEE